MLHFSNMCVCARCGLNERGFTFLIIVLPMASKTELRVWGQMNVWKNRNNQTKCSLTVSRACDMGAVLLLMLLLPLLLLIHISSLANCMLHQCDSDTIRWSYVFVLSVLYVRYGYCRFSLEAENAFWEIPICDSLQKNIYVCIEHIVLAFRSWRRWLGNSFLSSSSYFFSLIRLLLFLSLYHYCYVQKSHWLHRYAVSRQRWRYDYAVLCCVQSKSIEE